jgi:hypothetical protein
MLEYTVYYTNIRGNYKTINVNANTWEQAVKEAKRILTSKNMTYRLFYSYTINNNH